MALDYEGARNDWMGNDEYDISSQDAARASMDRWRQKWGAGDLNNEVLSLSNGGGLIDLAEGFNSGTPKRRTWTAAGGNGPNPNGAGVGQSGSFSSGPAMRAGDTGNSRWDALYNQLYERANQGLAVSRNDPTIRAQSDAYAANEERARRNYLGDLAEKAGPGANMRGEERMSAERVGQRTGSVEAELMGRELIARRQEIADALQARQGMLTFEQQMALQEKLAAYDNAIKQQQIGLQGRGLDMQNAQFLANLGFQVEDRKNYWDGIRSGLLNGG